MSVDELELKCWVYAEHVKLMEEFVGESILNLNDIRTKMHNEICLLAQLNKEDTEELTDNLDKLNYDGTELYFALRDLMRHPTKRRNKCQTK